LALQFPGVYVPKQKCKDVDEVKAYVRKLAGFQHFLRNPVLKVFLEAKQDPKETLKIILKLYKD
jgi:hypothetical protein